MASKKPGKQLEADTNAEPKNHGDNPIASYLWPLDVGERISSHMEVISSTHMIQIKMGEVRHSCGQDETNQMSRKGTFNGSR